MNKYEKPVFNIIEFNNESNNMVLVSGNYNNKNIINSTEVNKINF